MEPHTPVILIVEDHLVTRRFLADNLAADGYAPLQAATVAEALSILEEAPPDLAIVDLGLPDRDGLELVREVRGAIRCVPGPDPDLPLLILSGRAAEVDRLRSFTRGADDFLAKPFSYPELRARIDALLRRSRTAPRPIRRRFGPLEIDPVTHEVLLDGGRIDLSRKEFELLSLLAREPTRVYTREELLREVWGFRSPGHTRTLDSHASRLRRKLQAGGHHFVLNVWGVGYRLADRSQP